MSSHSLISDLDFSKKTLDLSTSEHDKVKFGRRFNKIRINCYKPCLMCYFYVARDGLARGFANMEKDLFLEDEKLYTIREAAEICNTSRATLLRMEEAGFDAPRYIDEKSGYRYYDVRNIHRIKLYQMLQLMGLSNKEIHSYFDSKLDPDDFLPVLKDRLATAKRCVEEFGVRLMERGSLIYEYFTLSDVMCYVFETPISNPKKQIEYNYRKIQEIFDQGFKPATTEPMFSVAPGIGKIYGSEKNATEGMTIAVAVDPKHIPDPSKVVRFDSRNMFSLVYKGDDDDIMQNGADILFEEMKQRGLKPKGPCYGISILGPFFGIDIDPEDYVFRWAIPVDI